MIRTRFAWVPTTLLCGALLAGCGSSSSTTTSTASSTPAAAAQPTPAVTSSTPATTAPSATATSGNTPDVKLAAKVCKSATALADLPASLRARVEQVCHDYSTGNVSQAREAAKNACSEAVEKIPGDSPAKQQALAHCKGK
jgi:Flp pilus assembly protein TadD